MNQDDANAEQTSRKIRELTKQRDTLLALLERASESLGSFTSDEGWSQADMDTMDSIDSVIAKVKGGTA